ncbi:MAG: leucine-rich repeat domain-containing protein, partial [Oscillospiraceae bacterium]|nr:leucine-rich repeat domain-containing protein [Oscillospiraceae bacterium]
TTTTTTPEPISKISYSDGEDGITIDAYRWTDEMTVTIPDQINGRPVTKIAPEAFRYCYADEVLLPDTITEIGADAFKGCRYLKKIVIPKGCLLIGRGAFQDCTQLDTVEFPETAPEIEPSAFDRTAYITRLTDTLVIIGNGLLYAYHGTAAEVTLPDTVKQINANAFANHTELTAITIPESVTRIDTNAFLGCTGLSSITLLGTPERIAKDAFTDTAWARDSKEDLLVLGATVLSYRGNQTVPEIPDGVTAIASGAAPIILGLQPSSFRILSAKFSPTHSAAAPRFRL